MIPMSTELDSVNRFEIRLAIEAAGAECQSYHADGYTFGIKRDCLDAVTAEAARHGMSPPVPGTYDLCCFPLGSDAAADEWRHYCHPYTAERGHRPGFRLLARFRFPTRPAKSAPIQP